MQTTEHFFTSREEASLAAAAHIVAALTRQLESQETASLVVTGGSSPGHCYAAMTDAELAWDRVRVTLSDERWVPPSHADSNEKMLRETLFSGRAGAASFLPLYEEEQTLAAQCEVLNTALPALGLPFACTLLGMGDDGHIASLFPDADSLELGLRLDGDTFAVPATTAASPHPRISLTLAALTRSNEIVLLIFGDTKREIYTAAKTATMDYPVTALLSQQHTPVHVFWAP